MIHGDHNSEITKRKVSRPDDKGHTKMVLVQASRLPQGLRDRVGSHLDGWLLLIVRLACIPHFITAILLIHSLISITDIPSAVHCYCYPCMTEASITDNRIPNVPSSFTDVPACQKSTRWGCHEEAAWWACYPCRTLPQEYPAPKWLHRRPGTNIVYQ